MAEQLWWQAGTPSLKVPQPRSPGVPRLSKFSSPERLPSAADLSEIPAAAESGRSIRSGVARRTAGGESYSTRAVPYATVCPAHNERPKGPGAEGAAEHALEAGGR